MVDTIPVDTLPIKPTPVGSDTIIITDSADGNTTKQVLIEDLGNGLDVATILSTDADNLLVKGSDDKIRLEMTADVISSDAGNILQKGTDGKALVPSVAASLTENNMWIGGATNTPEEKTDLEVRNFLGLPTDYIKDDIQYVSANQVSWQGKCRDSSDSRDFELGSATTASLVSPSANTTYNLFVAGNTLVDAPVVVWDVASSPSGYTYYRRVLSIVTDGIGNIIQFSTDTMSSGALKIIYYNQIIDRSLPLVADTIEDVDITVPNGIKITPLLTGNVNREVSGNAFPFINEFGKTTQFFLGTVNSASTFSSNYINSITTTNAKVSIYSQSNDVSLYQVITSGYKDERI